MDSMEIVILASVGIFIIAVIYVAFLRPIFGNHLRVARRPFIRFINKNYKSDTFNYSMKTVDEHGCKFWFDAGLLHNVDKITYGGTGRRSVESCVWKWYPIKMFKDYELDVDYKYDSNLIDFYQGCWNTYGAKMTWIIITMHKPEDAENMALAAQEIWKYSLNTVIEKNVEREREIWNKNEKLHREYLDKMVKIAESKQICSQVERKLKGV